MNREHSAPKWFPPRLHTARLCLRPLNLADVDAVHAYASDPQVARFTLWDPHQTREESESYVRDVALVNYSRETADPFALELRESPGDVVGTAGCSWVSEPHSTMELGFALARRAWGTGLATEAAWAVLCFVFSIYRPERVQARCHVDNGASSRVLEKLGMMKEGVLRRAITKGGRSWDIEMHSILRTDWRSFIHQNTQGPPGRPLPILDRS